MVTSNGPASLDVQKIDIQGQRIRIGVSSNRQAQRHCGRPMLLFNGIGAPLESAFPFIRELRSTSVITLDIPGVGQSPMPNRPYRLSGLTSLVDALLDQLGYQQVDVLGISWGGCLAQQFVYDYPQRCQRLVLAVTSAGSFMIPGRPSTLLKMLAPWRFISLESMSMIAPPINGKRTESYTYAVTQFARQLFAGSKRSYLLQLLAVAGWSSLPWLHKLSLPTLVIMGEDDPIVPPVNGTLLCKRLPDARMCTFQGGHLFMLTQPASAASTIEAFLTHTETNTEDCR